MKKLFSLLSISALYFSFIIQTKPMGLNVGEMAPAFTAKDQNGKTIVLRELIKKGPVVLVFYRGEWCPYCNKQLKELSDSIPYITAKGARVIAISPENAMNVAKTVEKTKANYSIISDEKSALLNEYKVGFTPDEKMSGALKGYGVDLMERNGTNEGRLPVPTVYIVNKAGTITYKHFDDNYTKRASVKELLNHL